MTKDVFCIMTGEHILHVVKKERVEKSLSAWKGSYKDARDVPAEEAIDTSNPVIEQVKELFRKMDCPYTPCVKDGGICVSIVCGDWRHDHKNADYIMETAFGYKASGETVTQRWDEETYSSVHMYAAPASC